MKWLFLLSAKSWGGNEHWTRLAAHALRDAGHEVRIACRREDIAARFDCPTLLLPFRHEADLSTIAGLHRAVRAHGIDVLLPTKRKDYVLAGWVAKATGIPNLLRLGIVRPLGEGLVNRFVYGTMADGIIVNAEAIAATLRASSFIRPDRVRVIYNGVDAAAVRERAAAQPVERPHRFLVSGSGMLIRRKGFDRIIRAIAQVHAARPDGDVGLRIVGEGAERGALKALARELGIADRVHLAGHRDNPHPLIAASDLFVMASDNEGISNALLEAMALGVPVISTRSGGAAEAIENGRSGILVDDDAPETLAAAIDALLGNPERREALAAAARNRIAERFSLDAMRAGLETFAAERVIVKEKARAS